MCELQAKIIILDGFNRAIGYNEFECSNFIFLHPFDSRSLKAILRRDNFDYPVCMDIDDKLNRANHFSSDINFQTFFLQ